MSTNNTFEFWFSRGTIGNRSYVLNTIRGGSYERAVEVFDTRQEAFERAYVLEFLEHAAPFLYNSYLMPAYARWKQEIEK